MCASRNKSSDRDDTRTTRERGAPPAALIAHLFAALLRRTEFLVGTAQDNRYAFFEEPVPFDWYEETKQVADALRMPIAGGEQEPSLHNFRWLVAHGALPIVQQDMFYFGGMVRSIRVPRMAHALGKRCIPHIPGSGLGYLDMMHFVSAIPHGDPITS